MTDYAKLKNQVQPIEGSTSIKEIGWEAGVLTLRFAGPAFYCYEGVARDRYLDLLRSKSPGKFFQAEIKGKFDETKVEPPASALDEADQNF
jgi:hypothetical protein